MGNEVGRVEGMELDSGRIEEFGENMLGVGEKG